jgi:hypothetical protein
MDRLLPGLTLKALVIILAAAIVATIARNYFNKGFNKYPGPLLASFTDAWRFWSVHRGKSHLNLRRLHDQHGDVVRLGPNSLSFSNPEALKAIYSLNNRLTKARLSFNTLATHSH